MRVMREDIRVPDSKADLYLVGLGIGGFSRRTIEADQVLRGCATILHLTAYDSVLRRTFVSDIINLDTLYNASSDPAEVYEGMADLIFGYVERNHFLGSVAFLTYGHPLFLVDTSWDLMRRCAEAGLRAKPLAATSFVDQVLCDLGKRFDAGVQLFEASTFVKERVSVDSRFPLLLSQVGDFGANELRSLEARHARMAILFGYLRGVYPPTRKCTLIMSSWRADMAPEVTSATLAEIDTLISSVHIGCSLYIDGIHD